MGPFWIAALLLVLTEAVLHLGPVRHGVEALSEGLWLDREVTRRASAIMPLHQDLAERPMNEAYLRGLARTEAGTRIVVVGDSIVWQTPDHVAFHQELGRVLASDFPGSDVQVYALCMPGMNCAAAFYLLKAMLAEFRPDLVIYVANPALSGQELSDAVPRYTAFMDRPFFSDDEARAYARVIKDSQSEVGWQRHFSFTTVHDLLNIRYGGALRHIMLPPAVFSGLSSRCYLVECQDTNNIYWKDLGKKRKKRDTKAIRNMQRFVLSEQGINYTYLLLLPGLMAANDVPFIAIIPPKNRELIEELGAPWEETVKAGQAYVADLEKRGVPVIDCTSAVPEIHFRDTQHLRTEGLKMWVQYIRAPLEQEMKERVLK